MSKRAAEGQGDKTVGSLFESAEETPVKASAAQMAGRRIISAKSRKNASPGFSSGSSLQALGNPFASPSSEITNGTTAPSTSTNIFNQQSNGFNFTAPQPLSNNSQPFGSQSASFPPAQSSSGSVFGGSFSAPSGGFRFSSAGSNPFSQNKALAFGGFGQPNGVTESHSQEQGISSGQDMQISPPTTPSKGVTTASTPSIFGAMAAPAPLKTPFTFGQPQSQSQQSAPSETPGTSTPQPNSNLFAFNPTQPPFGGNKQTAFSFGQPSATAPESQSTMSKPQNSPFQPFSNTFQDPAPSTHEAQPPAASAPSATPAAPSLFQSNQGFSFGSAQPLATETPAPTSSSTTSFQDSTSTPFKGFGCVGPAPTSSSTTGFQNSTSSPFKGFGSVAPAPSAPSQSAPTELYPRLSKTNETTTSMQPLSTPSMFSRPSQTTDAGTRTSSTNPFANIQTTQSLSQTAPSEPKASAITRSNGEGQAPDNLNSHQMQAYQSHLDLRTLNAAFRTSIERADANANWTDMNKAYISQFNKLSALRSVVEFEPSSGLATMSNKRRADEDLPNESAKKSRASEAPAKPAEAPPQNMPGKSQTANLFQSILDKKDTAEPSTPTKPSTNFFTPSTTPAGPPPSTNVFANLKPAQSTTPASSLFSPKTANQAAPSSNLFAAPLAKTAPQPSTMSQSRTADDAPANPFASVLKGPSSGASNNAFAAPAPSNMFSPKPSNTANASIFNPFAAKTSSDKIGSAPTAKVSKFGSSAAPVNFLSQFGSKASKDAEKVAADIKAKRKADEFDSDEDDEAEWERNYQEELAQKKAEIEKAAAFQLPKFGASASVGGTDFLSQFGSSAAKSAAEEKAKRKAEEFDSDEDNEEEWERNYEEEQRQKKARLAESTAAKFVPGEGFKFGASAPVQPPASTSGSSADSNKNGFTPSKGTSVFSSSITNSRQPSASENIFGHLSDAESKEPSDDEESADEHDEQGNGGYLGQATADSTSGRNLFDRVTPDQAIEREPAKTTSSPAADHTWKIDSPIKFGNSGPALDLTAPTPTKVGNSAPAFNFTAPTPTRPTAVNGTENAANASRPFAGIFSSPKPDTGMSLFGSAFNKPAASSAKPSEVGFSFGGPPTNASSPAPSLLSAAFGAPNGSALTSAATSRASSPGVPPSVAESTDGAAADADAEDGEPAVAQTDFTALTDEEKREEDLLFEVEKSRSSLFTKGADQPWQTKGTGPLRILKNKTSGVVRILLRAARSGKVVLNTRLNKGFTYTFAGRGTTRLLIVGAASKPETWAVKMAKDEDAKEFARLCEANKGA